MSSMGPTIKDYLFYTGHKRKPDLLLFETTENIKANNEFYIKFFLTNNEPKPESHFVIIVNGFNEMKPDAYHNKRRGVCKLLLERGISSALLPIPNHMNRLPADVPYLPNTEPKDLVTLNKDRFYAGYEQEIADIEKLSKLLKRASGSNVKFADGTKLSSYFNNDTKVHLLGYSIGGLAVLSAFLKADLEKSDLYDTCTLLSSGANFQTLNPEELIGLDEITWKLIKHHYLGKMYVTEESEKTLLSQIFEMVLLGEKHDRFHEIIRDLSNRIFAVCGANDDVSSPEAIINLEPAETGLAVIKVPSLEHPFASKGWIYWHNWIMDCIASFIKNHSKKVIKEKPYKKAALRRLINGIITTSKNMLPLDRLETYAKKLRRKYGSQ